MYSFNGDFRQKPIQSMRGASKKEPKELLLKRAQEERQRREDTRVRIASALKVQSFYRGYLSRKTLWGQLRDEFDIRIKQKEFASEMSSLHWCVTKLCLFFCQDKDGQRLIFLCQDVIRRKEEFLNAFSKDSFQRVLQLKRFLKIVVKYLHSLADSASNTAIPMRMLEIFLSPNAYSEVKWTGSMNTSSAISDLLLELVNNGGYFECLRKLLNSRVPQSLEKSHVPPTPVAGSIFDLIMSPVGFAVSSMDKSFRREILRQVTRTFLCKQYTEQIAFFLLPAMAYGKYPFPFVELVQTLIEGISIPATQTNPNSQRQTPTVQGADIEDSAWLLSSVLTLANKELDHLDAASSAAYLILLRRLLLQLPPSRLYSDSADDSDSEDEEPMELDVDPDLVNLQNVQSECLRLIDSGPLLKCVYNCLANMSTPDVIESIASISHSILAHQKMALHRIRLLYVLAFNPQFMRHLWNLCISVSVTSVTGSSSSLISMLANGVHMSKENISRIVPLLTTFACLFDHSLLTLHDSDFYGENEASKSNMPFSVREMVQMCSILRDSCLGIIELAHPDSRSTNKDYLQALQKIDGLNRRNNNDDEFIAQTKQWSYIFKAVTSLVRQLHNRDSRRPFCPSDHWLAPRISVRIDRPAQIYESQNLIFKKRDFISLSSLTKANSDMGIQPLANRDVRNLVILTELPFVVPFLDRVNIMHKLVTVDKREHQGNMTDFGMGPSIHINIRRNFLYEDAFEKLSPENEPNLKKKMRVKLLNVAGMDEAGIDGGGIFREFLSELLKTGFDPNRGFFKYSADRLLYPNPEAAVIVDNFVTHFYFLGRMLGKALMENLMVEIPFASFFLTKILSPSNSSLDIHHLQSMDPEVYKNLLSLNNFEGDVSELGLDFSVVNSQFGETMVEDLKANGRNISVANANVIEYIHLMADYKINKQIRAHCNAFRRGLDDVIHLEWLQMFNSGELQILISGAAVPIDLEDLRINTKYSGEFADNHPVIEMFWVVVDEFTDQQKRQLLKFVTSCSRPPLLGFRDLYPAFCIHSGGIEEDRLPTASTCMNLLKLPAFQDRRTMKSKLLYAIESGAGFELS